MSIRTVEEGPRPLPLAVALSMGVLRHQSLAGNEDGMLVMTYELHRLHHIIREQPLDTNDAFDVSCAGITIVVR